MRNTTTDRVFAIWALDVKCSIAVQLLNFCTKFS